MTSNDEGGQTPGPVAVVTGAGSGLGRCIARTLLDNGYRVALLGRTPSTLQDSAAGSDQALVLACDVTVPDDVTVTFDMLVERWGRLDLLVNNAGVFGPVGDADQVWVEDWLDTIATNLTGSFLCAREAFRVMKAQRPRGGRIINNGSIAAYAPRPKSIAYTASKHAITGLTKSLSLDGRAHDIACGQIDIGNAATDFGGLLTVPALQPDGSRRSEPTFDPQHAADAVLQMAQLPPQVNVQFITIMATAMPYLGRG